MKILKWIGIAIAILFIVGFLAIKLLSQSEPNEIGGENADLLANQMLESLDVQAWDTLNFISWKFRGQHQYYWNKRDEMAIIEYGNTSVLMDLNTIEINAYSDGKLLEGKKKEKARKKAWSIWCNDSFWLCAPFKIYDKGVKRSVVEMDNGEKGLMASYTSGGVTPGDKYMWILDENNRPTGWRMWTKILPVKGLYTSWENWLTLPGGAQIAREHRNGKIGMSLDPIKGGQLASDIGKSEEDFVLK